MQGNMNENNTNSTKYLNVNMSVSVSHPQSQAGEPIKRTSPITGRSHLDSKPERNLWREHEMLQLLAIMSDTNAVELLNDKTVRSETVFRNIEKLMHNHGYRKKTYMQIWTKWKFLKSTYTTSRRARTIPKVVTQDVYDALHELLDATTSLTGNAESSTSPSSQDGSFVGNSNLSTVSDTASLMNGHLHSTAGIINFEPKTTNTVTFPRSEVDKQTLIGGIQGSLNNKVQVALVPENDSNSFGMQHPIFGFRLGVVKQEPMDQGKLSA